MKNNLTQPDPLLSLLHQLQEQRDELNYILGDYMTRVKILNNDLKDLQLQIEVLDVLDECIDDLNDRILERAKISD
jgi:hypothetical protein